METPFITTSLTTKFSDYVPTLKGEANQEIQKQYVEISLNSIDPTFWPIFVGDNKRPPNLPSIQDNKVFEDTVTEIDNNTPTSDFAPASSLSAFTSTSTSVPTPAPASDPAPAPAAAKTAIAKRVKEQLIWDRKNAVILTHITSYLDISLIVYVRRGYTASMVYQELRHVYKAKTFFNVSIKANKWLSQKYKPSIKPDDFVNKWRLLYNKMQGAFPIKQRIPPLFALYTFLYAIGNNTTYQNWLNSVTIHNKWLYNKNL